MATITFIVKVSSGKYYIDEAGNSGLTLTWRPGDTYIFDQSDSSNDTHLLKLSTTTDGTHTSGGAEYTTGVTYTGTPGTSGAKTTIVTSGSTATSLFYYCANHPSYGGAFSSANYNTSTNLNLIKPQVGKATGDWGPMVLHALDQIDQRAPNTFNEGSNTILMPSGRASQNNYVLAMTDISNGTTGWQVTATAPTITGVSGELNVYESSSSTEDGGVLTLTGTDFGTQSDIDSIEIMDSSKSNKVTASSFTVNSATSISVTFAGTETGYNSWGTGGLASTNWHIQVTKSGLSSNAFNSGKSFTKDPTISSVTQTASGDNNDTLTFDGTGGVWGSYGGQTAGGGQDSNTKLLLNFDRTGGTDIEDSSNTGGNGHKITASGNAVIKSSPFGDGKSAMYFGGSGNKLVIADHDDFTIGTNDFTLEFWINLSSVQNWKLIAGLGMPEGSSDTALTLGTDSGGNIEVEWNDSGSSEHILEGYQANRWYHIAISRQTSGGTTTSKAFIDGIGKDITIPATLNNPTGGMNFGSGSGDYTGHFNGYLDEIRFLNGTGAYRNDFDVPTSRLTAITNTKLLIHSDQTYDSSDYNHVVTAKGDAHMTTTNGRANWNNSSWSLDGTDDYLVIPKSSNFNFGTDDFCIEFWWRGDFGANDVFWSFGDSGATGNWMMYQEASNKVRVTMGSDGTRQFDTDSSTVWQGDSSWHHFAMTKTGTTLKLYIDGIEETTVNASFNSTPSSSIDLSSFDLAIGTDTNGDYDLAGNIVDFRIVKGTTVYTGGNFDNALPTGSLTKTGGTYAGTTNRTDPTATQTLLLINGDGAKFDDSSTSDHDITPTGSYHSQAHGGIAPAMAFSASGKLTGSAGVYFDGNGDEVNINASTELSRGSSDPFTFECWFYLTASGGQTIFESRDSDYSPQSLYINIQTDGWVYVRTNSSGGISLDDDGSSGDIGTGRFYPNLNTWYHIAVSRGASAGGSNTGTIMRVYVNGRYLEKVTDADLTTVGAHDWSLGHSHSSDYFTGYIDQVRWHNTALYTHETFGSGNWPDSSMPQPTKIYGAYGPTNPSIGSIEIVTATDDDVNVTYSFQGSTEDNATVLGTSSDLAIASDTTGANKKKGTLTGTLQGTAGSVTNLRIQAKANNDSNRLVEVNETSGVGAIRLDKVASGKPVLFNARRYAGNSTNRSINGLGFQPDLVWIKGRDYTDNHQLFDSVRGHSKTIRPDINNVEVSSNEYGYLDGFSGDGFSLKGGTNANAHYATNHDGQTYISWSFKAGGAPSGDGKKIVDGTESNLTSGTDYSASDFSAIRQSVNTNGDFSITTYTANGSTDGWFKHGLSGTPDWVIIKSTSATYHWIVWHSGLNSGSSTNASDYIQLNDSSQKGYYGGSPNTDIDPWAGSGYGITSDKINLNYGGVVLESGQSYVCYAWKAVAGVSAFGSYTGASGGNKVTTNFRPRWIMTKASSNSSDYTGWTIIDAFRSDLSGSSELDADASPVSTLATLYADQSKVENKRAGNTDPSNTKVIIYDDGFKFTEGQDETNSHAGWTYIYMAFA